jgi:hypothetical protein
MRGGVQQLSMPRTADALGFASVWAAISSMSGSSASSRGLSRYACDFRNSDHLVSVRCYEGSRPSDRRGTPTDLAATCSEWRGASRVSSRPASPAVAAEYSPADDGPEYSRRGRGVSGPFLGTAPVSPTLFMIPANIQSHSSASNASTELPATLGSRADRPGLPPSEQVAGTPKRCIAFERSTRVSCGLSFATTPIGSFYLLPAIPPSIDRIRRGPTGEPARTELETAPSCELDVPPSRFVELCSRTLWTSAREFSPFKSASAVDERWLWSGTGCDSPNPILCEGRPVSSESR